MLRRYHVRTYGCQMNQHDSEKVENLLHHAGWRPAGSPGEADLLLINTCSIRAKAEHRLGSDLGTLRDWKRERPGRVLGVGGCVAQQEGDALLRRFGHLDFVVGTHNLRLVPSLVAAALGGERRSETAETRSLERFDLPERHPATGGRTPSRAWLTVMEGCDLFCSFCIVPRTRGREVSRPADAILAEARALAERGVAELTLLGQTVNAYGRHEQRRAASAGTHRSTGKGGTLPFAALLTELAAIPGIERLRYTSPHPIFFDEALIRAHAELPALQPHVHLPLQSGSDRVLERMRRRYDTGSYLALVARLREGRPDLAITTDLIVGFPGETRADFEDTLRVVREAAFVDSYSFKYSPRPGTKAAELEDPVAPEEAQERLARLQALQRELTLAYHRSRVGETTRVLVEGPSRHAGGTGSAGGPQAPLSGGQLSGRDPYHRVVNFEAQPGTVRAGARVRLR
ncbi:MAG: tRNA (N6-isopentenyl adenosine(37)-C2)-methylthiotransferase MiaB, partial [Myxococcota bacterium]